MKRLCLLFVLFTGPAWAQLPDDNPMADAYRRGNIGTPGDNFMHNSYERHGPGTIGDNFMQDLTTPQRPQRWEYDRR